MIRNIKRKLCERTSIVHRASGEPTAPHERVIGTNDRRQLNSGPHNRTVTPYRLQPARRRVVARDESPTSAVEPKLTVAEGAMVCPPPPGRTHHERPHRSLDYQTPAQFAAAWLLRSGCALRSSSTREHKKKKTKERRYPLPNPYSHNPWTESGAFRSCGTEVIQCPRDRTSRGSSALDETSHFSD